MGIDRQRFADLPFGRAPLAALEMNIAEQIKRIEIVPVGFQDIPIELFGAIEIPCLMGAKTILQAGITHAQWSAVASPTPKPCGGSPCWCRSPMARNALSRLRADRVVSNRLCVARLRCSRALMASSASRLR